MARKALAQRFEEQVDRSEEHHLWTGARKASAGRAVSRSAARTSQRIGSPGSSTTTRSPP
jgi:hypothetical protein